MMKVKVPVDFTFEVASEEEAKVRVDEYLTRAATEYGRMYGLTDYEIPYGYEIEKVSDS